MGSREAAALIALFGAEDGELLVGWEDFVLECFGGGRAAVAVGGEVGEGVSVPSFCLGQWLEEMFGEDG